MSYIEQTHFSDNSENVYVRVTVTESQHELYWLVNTTIGAFLQFFQREAIIVRDLYLAQ